MDKTLEAVGITKRGQRRKCGIIDQVMKDGQLIDVVYKRYGDKWIQEEYTNGKEKNNKK